MTAADRARLIDTLTGGCTCPSCQEVVPRLVDALVYLGDEAAAMRKGLRGAAPTPVQGVDAGLLMIELAAAHAAGRDVPANQLLEQKPRLSVAS